MPAGRGVPPTPGAGGGLVLQRSGLAMPWAPSVELLKITSHKAKMTPGNGVGGIDFKGAPEFGLGL